MTDSPKSHGRISIKATTKPSELIQNRPDLEGIWKAKVITLFPEMFPGGLGNSLVGRALHENLWSLETISLRDFGEGKHKNVDDTPAGGGAGMILRADIIGQAIKKALSTISKKNPIIYLSARGKPFDQKMAERFSKTDGITLLCGRFEGVDQRVIDFYDIEEVSVGDVVLTGGEIPAQIIIDGTVRLLPNVIGNKSSLDEESFANGLLEHPQYTRPKIWNNLVIPEVLSSGNHKKINEWRLEQSKKLTKSRRPDLWEIYKTQKNIKSNKDL